MYDVTNKSRKELALEICRQLNEKGFVAGDEPFSLSSGFGCGLRYMPKENLIKMLSTDITDCEDFNKVYACWGRARALRFKPYSNHDSVNLSLVIRHNRFLHMFRGYYFQVSITVDGDGDVGHGCYRTDFLTMLDEHCSALRESLITYTLWWAAYIDVVLRFDNFKEAFYEDVKDLEDFLHESMKCWRASCSYHWSDVSSLIKFDNTSIITPERKMYQIAKAGKIFAYFAIGSKTIQVQTCKGTWTLTLPDDSDLSEGDLSFLMKNHYLEMLVVMLLTLADIHLNFVGWYANSRKCHITPLSAINAPGVVTVNTLNDIYGVTPDDK